MLKLWLIEVLRRLGLLAIVERATRPLRFALRRPKLRRFYAQFVRPGDLCFDVGANVGQWTAALLGLGARVVAVEPQSQCVAKLRRRFAGNPQVILVPKAVSSTVGTAQLALATSSSELATLARKWRQEGPYSQAGWGQSEEVSTTTLDELVAQHGMPRLIKIDVEGHEPEVLAGLSHLPSLLCFEFTSQFLDDADRCMRRLESIGAAQFNVAFCANPTHLNSPAWLGREQLLQLIQRAGQEAWTGDIYARPRD